MEDIKVLEKINVLLAQKNLKKSDLARGIGMTPQRVNNWFSRKKLPFEYISQIAEFLGVSTDYLLNNKDNVKNKLEYLLNKKGKSQTDLANYLGVDLSTITAWKKRNSISKRYISKVAEFLGVSTDYLLNDNTQIIAHNSPIIHNSPNSQISINEAINTLPSEIGAVVKYMLKLNEDERLEFMSKVFSCGKKEQK